MCGGEVLKCDIIFFTMLATITVKTIDCNTGLISNKIKEE